MKTAYCDICDRVSANFSPYCELCRKCRRDLLMKSILLGNDESLD